VRVLVTGATGFIGGRLARRLLADGHEVVALVRDPARGGELAAAGAELVQADITDPASLPPAMAGVEAAFHLAAWYKVGARDRARARRINVEGTRNVLLAMGEAGVAKGVYTSSIAIYSDTRGREVEEGYRFTGRHISLYDATKAEAHWEVAVPALGEGLPLVIVQPGLVYGPGDTSAIGDLLRRYLRRKLPMVPRGPEYCWAHVDDIVAGHLLALEKGRVGESYHLTGPRASLVEALELAERLTGVPAPRLRPGPAFFRAMSWLMQPVSWLLPLPTDLHPETLRVLAGATYLASSAKARRELGWACRGLEEGLGETLGALAAGS